MSLNTKILKVTWHGFEIHRGGDFWSEQVKETYEVQNSVHGSAIRNSEQNKENVRSRDLRFTSYGQFGNKYSRNYTT